MVRAIEIYNFRCFKHLALNGLQRINIIVGRNSSGKTALLESLFISGGSAGPAYVLQIRQNRQVDQQLRLQIDASAYQSLWEDLFHLGKQSAPVQIDVIGDRDDSRRLTISYTDPNQQLVPFDNPAVEALNLSQIQFLWERSGREAILTTPRWTSVGINIESSGQGVFQTLHFGPHIPDTAEDNARRFSELSRRGAAASVLEALRSEFPFVQDLSIEFSAGGPAIFAKLDGFDRKVAVGFVSDGVNKLLGLLLGIATSPGGLVLIDQIEDGFYYDRLPSIWRLIYRFAIGFDTQIFATTHSKESLQSLQEVLTQHEDDFTLLRADRRGAESFVRVIDGHYFDAALLQGSEVR